MIALEMSFVNLSAPVAGVFYIFHLHCVKFSGIFVAIIWSHSVNSGGLPL